MFSKEEDLDTFLQDCRVSYLSSGSFGFIFVVESDTSPYVSIRDDKRINKMIIKICGISNHTFPLIIKIGEEQYKVKTVTEKSFEREIEIQTELFFRTCEYLDPICPCIIHTEVKRADYDSVKRKVDTYNSINDINIVFGNDDIAFSIREKYIKFIEYFNG